MPVGRGRVLRFATWEEAEANVRDLMMRWFAVPETRVVKSDAQIQTEHVWSQGWMDIIQNGMTPEAAAEKSFKRAAEILAKYPVAQA